MTEKTSTPFEINKDTDLKKDDSDNLVEMEFSFFDDGLNASEKDENNSDSVLSQVASSAAEPDLPKDQDKQEDAFFSFDDPSESGLDFFSTLSKDDVSDTEDVTEEGTSSQSGITEDDFSFFAPSAESSSETIGISSSENPFQSDKAAGNDAAPINTINEDDFSFFDSAPESIPDVFSESSEKAISQPDVTTEINNSSENEPEGDEFSFFDAQTTSIANALKESANSNFTGMADSQTNSGDITVPQSDDVFHFEEVASEEQQPSAENEDLQDLTTSVETLLPVIPKPEKMRFTCEKCSTANELDIALPLGDTYNLSCSSCSSNMKIVIESSILRAVQKSREKFCIRCGGRIDYHIYCPSCGLFCPDYYLLETSADIKRKTRAKQAVELINTLAGFKSLLAWRRTPSSKTEPQQDQKKMPKAGDTPKTARKMNKLATVLIVISILLTVSGACTFFYLKQKIEKTFATDYINAAYAIKTGADTKFGSLTKIASDWKTATDSGIYYKPRLDEIAEAKSVKIKTGADKLLQKLQKVPNKFQQSYAKLLALNNVYGKIYRITDAMPATLDQLNETIANSDKAFKQASQDLKASLPELLSQELKVAKTKYRGLADF